MRAPAIERGSRIDTQTAGNFRGCCTTGQRQLAVAGAAEVCVWRNEVVSISMKQIRMFGLRINLSTSSTRRQQRPLARDRFSGPEFGVGPNSAE